jgi:hypothetical protein
MDRSSDRDRANSTEEEGTTAAERDHEQERHAGERQDASAREVNPPRTTTGRMTSPKFGSATSGGGEIEPGPEQD